MNAIPRTLTLTDAAELRAVALAVVVTAVELRVVMVADDVMRGEVEVPEATEIGTVTVTVHTGGVVVVDEVAVVNGSTVDSDRVPIEVVLVLDVTAVWRRTILEGEVPVAVTDTIDSEGKVLTVISLVGAVKTDEGAPPVTVTVTHDGSLLTVTMVPVNVVVVADEVLVNSNVERDETEVENLQHACTPATYVEVVTSVVACGEDFTIVKKASAEKIVKIDLMFDVQGSD
ncbi:hypothetical protein H0H92_006089 [Tricholoma furcatifolium]|nr:hypothetical protein H0H92_006089 [Tricholoma furcatifolium]